MTPDHPVEPDQTTPARAPRPTPLSTEILRFAPGERSLHWALAIPFVLFYLSAGVLILFYGESHPRHVRNAAEKLNFMMVSLFYPLYIGTGILVWLPGEALVAYLAHYAMAVSGLALVLGHIFMATVAPSTRVGLSGMVTGWVDRGWAKHHYRRWYRDHFEQRKVATGLFQRLQHPARVRCGSCQQVQSFPSWNYLIERSLQVKPLVCSSCRRPVHIVGFGDGNRVSEAIVQHVQTVGDDAPLESQRAGVA
jgi:cytochrome b subunit of formate dehydrogenase